MGQLDSILGDPLVTTLDADGARRKLIIFTESRDTLKYLADRIRTRLGKPELICAEDKDRVLWLADLPGHVAPDDARLAALARALGGASPRVVVLGAYAQPLTARDLSPVKAKKKKGSRP